MFIIPFKSIITFQNPGYLSNGWRKQILGLRSSKQQQRGVRHITINTTS